MYYSIFKIIFRCMRVKDIFFLTYQFPPSKNYIFLCTLLIECELVMYAPDEL